MKNLFLILSFVIALAAVPAHAADKNGSFKGANNHVTTGNVTVMDTGDSITIKFSSDFSLDGAPDPYVSLADGTKKPLANIAVLKNKNGAQSYKIKKTAALSNASHVLIWCEKFAVTLGHAKLK